MKHLGRKGERKRKKNETGRKNKKMRSGAN